MTAMVVAQGLHRRKAPLLAVDLGTNGEVVLAAGRRLLTCSTAAGPAFEGERIGCGVRAMRGAVERVRVLRRGIVLDTIGDAPPIGLCGSGIISAISELLRCGVIEPSGRLRSAEEIDEPRLAERIRTVEGLRCFMISEQPEIALRQTDIREVQLGKAAVSAGIRALAEAAQLDLGRIRTALVAGSFGSSLRPSAARRLGLFPPPFEGGIEVVGNTAVEGARILLASRRARREAAAVSRAVTHVELFALPGFKDAFYSSMHFPEP
jgi:uncharacterized 2Fe-2S/4Fe-4S cluster protein (DUF4445 family)